MFCYHFMIWFQFVFLFFFFNFRFEMLVPLKRKECGRMNFMKRNETMICKNDKFPLAQSCHFSWIFFIIKRTWKEKGNFFSASSSFMSCYLSPWIFNLVSIWKDAFSRTNEEKKKNIPLWCLCWKWKKGKW